MKKPDWKKWVSDKKDCKIWLDHYLDKKMLIKRKKEDKLFFAKSEHNLNFANWVVSKQPELKGLFNDSFYDWAVSGYYYAVYHSALALISMKGYESRSHMATLCFIIYHYYHWKKILEEQHLEVISGSIDKEDIQSIARSKSLRERASYNVEESFERNIADDLRNDAVHFIQKVRSILADKNEH
ncbi:MAG: HEPN domain-containing protein [Nanoarchaeota archaeon]